MFLYSQIDILFIHPNHSDEKIYQYLATEKITACEPPTFAALMASYARNKGYRIALADMSDPRWNKANLLDYINKVIPTLIVVVVYGQQPSASTQCIPATIEVCNAIKLNNPNTKIMACGTHIAALPKRSLKDLNIDFACYNEGFSASIELAEVLLNNSDDFSNINGIYYYKDNNLVVTPRGKNLTGFEFDNFVKEPAWDLLDMNIYRCSDWHSINNDMNRSPYASIYTTFNCIYHCSYCCIAAPFGGPGYTKFNPIIVANQIEKLVKQYGIKQLKIVDEMFLLDAKHVLAICDEIDKRGLGNGLNIWYYGRIDVAQTLDKRNEELLERMLKSGFRWIALGIEAKDMSRVDSDKNCTYEDTVATINKIKGHGVNIIGNYIFGLPNDDLKSMQATLDMALELKTEWVNMYSAQLYPGSQLHREAAQNGIIKPEDVEEIGWIGYSQHSYESFPSSTKHLTNAEVQKFTDEAWFKYFSDSKFQEMVKNKFGTKAFEYVKMLASSPKLKRKIQGD